VASPLSQALGFKKSGVVNAAVSLSPESGRYVISIGDGVAKSGQLATVSGVVVVKEVCVFLATLADAYHGSVVNRFAPQWHGLSLSALCWSVSSFVSPCGPLCWLE
jgi:hypothetical protein